MLKRKMFRDIKNNLSQFITIFLMITIGIMVYTGIESYMRGMRQTRAKFYTENNVQDLNLMGVDFSKNDLEKIKNLKHVKNAERKLSITATTDNDRILLLNVIETNEISKFYIIEGEQFDQKKSGVWLDPFYAKENNIKLGDTILVKYDTLELKEKVLGLINVPDHLYDTKDESELYPDRKKFGFAYINSNEIKDKFEIFNTIMVDVDKEKNKDIVKSEIENKIPSVKAIIANEDTASYITYQGEIEEGDTYVGVFSGLFLFIALLSVITTMTRVIKKERVQIGTLKALGFSNNRILLHYIGYGFWISLIAGIFGIISGYFFIGNVFMSLEMDFFEIPNGVPIITNSCYLMALVITLIVSFIIYLTGRKMLKENPAETLRSKIPNVKAKSLNITKKGIFKKLGFINIWNIRDIIRNKMRTFMGLAGVVGCSMLIVCALGMLDSMNYFIDLQFKQLYNFDYKLNLSENINNKNILRLENNYGDKTSKTYGIEIKNGKQKEANNLFVTDADNYIRFVDNNGKYIKVDSNKGVYVTYKLAKNNGYKLGDKITWHIYGDSKYYTSKIVGFNKDPQNQNVTATRKYLEKLGITYKPDALYTNNDLSKVKEIKNVETIQDIEGLTDGMTGMLSVMKTMLILIIGVAVLLGSVIIYNLGILSYTEKEYQFSTLKVLGFDDKKIKKIFMTQNNWIAIVSIMIGVPLGYYLTDFLFKTAIEEHYDFGAYITAKTYIIAAIGTFVVSYFVSKFLGRKVKNIDMVSSLKANE